MTALDSTARARLDERYKAFGALLADCRTHLDAGELDTAAAFAQTAATFAWFNPCGLFASAELETLVDELGRHLPTTAVGRPRGSDPQVVLHVATQIYQTGGPTQAISRWVRQDDTRRHLVCLTRQAAGPMPEKVKSLLARRDLIRLDRRPGGLMSRAARLRAVAARADVVLVHTHPYDVLPGIAFAADPGLPVIYVNHADHVFWLGVRHATAVMSMRESGHRVALDRRGVDPLRSFIMARPLHVPKRHLTRDEAKAQIGVPVGSTLIVTAADAAKYRPVAGRPGFLDLVMPVAETHLCVQVRAAGPAPEGEWSSAATRTSGRVRALGRVPDAAVLMQAADVYVDSFPFSSLTSLLEAGSYGTPVVTYRGHPPGCEVLGADTPGVDRHMDAPSDPAEFRAVLDRLVEDSEYRAERGSAASHSIVATHAGPGWQRSVDALYAFAAGLSRRPLMAAPGRQSSDLDLLVDLVMEQTRFSQGRPGALAETLGLFPGRARLAAYSELARAGMRPRSRTALPEWLLPALFDGRRLYRAILAAAQRSRDPKGTAWRRRHPRGSSTPSGT